VQLISYSTELSGSADFVFLRRRHYEDITAPSLLSSLWERTQIPDSRTDSWGRRIRLLYGMRYYIGCRLSTRIVLLV